MRNCKNPRDLIGSCFRCGEEGHNTKGCSKEPLRVLCPLGGKKHPTGSFSSPVYKKAVGKLDNND